MIDNDNDNKTLAEVWAEQERANAEALERLQPLFENTRALIEESDRKYGGPAPPLTEEERDEFDTEMRYFLMRGPPKKESS